MRSLPAGWPAPSNAATNDDVLISLPTATWLDGPQEVNSFSIKRELVGSILPGQVRAGSGLSVASGDCAFYYRSVDGAPWRQGDAKIIPTGTASLYAQAGSATIPLGTFDLEGATAKLSTPTMGLDLVDQHISQRTPNTLPSYLSADGTRPVESAWIVDQLARSLGYYSTPAPVESCVLSVPMSGAIESEGSGFGGVGTPGVESDGFLPPVTLPTGWDFALGAISPVGGFNIPYWPAAHLPVTSFFCTATLSGTVQFQFANGEDINGNQNFYFRINAATAELAVRNMATSDWVLGSYTAGSDPIHPLRVEVECERLGVAGAWTGFRARARSSATAAWGSWVTDAGGFESTADFVRVAEVRVAGGRMIGLQVTTASDPLVWAVPSASIYALGSTLTAGYLTPALDTWGSIQAIVAANLGAAWVDAAAKLIVRDYSWLRGARPVDAALVVDDDLDDLGWATSRDDFADRVTVTYQPPVVETRTPTTDPTVWTATEAYRIPALSTITVTFDTENVATDLWVWLAEWDLFLDWSDVTRWSRWNARPFRGGSGAQPETDALLFSVQQIQVSRYALTITNTTTSALFTVNAAGEPSLTLRANVMATFETKAIISSGVPEAGATSALTVDLGSHIQTDTDARRVLNFVTSQTSAPKAAVSQVLVPFDWRRELGDLYQLTHNGSVLNSKVLCVAIDLQGSPGDYRQLLDLVMLDTTLYDVDVAWDAANSAATLASRDAVWTGKTLGDIDLNPTRTA